MPLRACNRRANRRPGRRVGPSPVLHVGRDAHHVKSAGLEIAEVAPLPTGSSPAQYWCTAASLTTIGIERGFSTTSLSVRKRPCEAYPHGREVVGADRHAVRARRGARIRRRPSGKFRRRGSSPSVEWFANATRSTRESAGAFGGSVAWNVMACGVVGGRCRQAGREAQDLVGIEARRGAREVHEVWRRA